MCVFFAVVLMREVLSVSRVSYQPRRLETRDCVAGRVCSNFAPAVEYYCGVRTIPFVPAGETFERMRQTCDYVVYFKEVSGYSAAVNTRLQQRATLRSENTAAFVYQLQ